MDKHGVLNTIVAVVDLRVRSIKERKKMEKTEERCDVPMRGIAQ